MAQRTALSGLAGRTAINGTLCILRDFENFGRLTSWPQAKSAAAQCWANIFILVTSYNIYSIFSDILKLIFVDNGLLSKYYYYPSYNKYGTKNN